MTGVVLRLFVVLGFIASLWPEPAIAFGTIKGLGQHREHERITRLALRDAGLGPATLDSLAGAGSRFGAVGAPDRPFRGLMSVKAAHCDGGDHLDTPGYPHDAGAARRRLEACRDWIFAHIEAAVEAAGRLGGETAPSGLDCRFTGRGADGAKCEVLENLGLSLHAAQDFYAHTNWSDHPPGSPTGDDPPGLGFSSPAAFIDPAKRAPLPPGLISGCYDGFPEAFHCRGRASHRRLNKDNGVIDLASGEIGDGATPRGRRDGNFQRAAAAAIADTRAKWAYFEGEVIARHGAAEGARILCRIKSDRPETCQG